jgi:hypothetical protein
MTCHLYASAQCSINHNINGVSVSVGGSFAYFGQGFIAECDGQLEYVQFKSNSLGTVSAGTLSIYSGNIAEGTPLYTQSHPAITINNVGDPVRINITDTLNLTENNQYTFVITIDNVDILADYVNGYPNGTAFQNGGELSGTDFLFGVSILNNSLNTDNWVKNNLRLSPNPSSNFIKVSNLNTSKKYSIINNLGQEIIKGRISRNEKIEITNLMNGIYFLKFEDGLTLKFLKK